MHTYMLEEMADALANELHIQSSDALAILSRYWEDKIARSGAITTAEAAERVGQRVTIAGIRQTSRRSRTTRGEMMMFLSVEDLSGMLDVIIFPDVCQRVKSIASSNFPMLITGTVETDGERDEPFLKAEKVERLA